MNLLPLTGAPPPWLVVVRPERLDRTQRRQIARQSGIRPEDLDDRGMPELWVVEGATDAGMAGVEAARLRALGIDAEALPAALTSAWPALLGAATLALFALVSTPITAGLAAAALLSVGASLLAWVPFLLSMLISVAAVRLGQIGLQNLSLSNRQIQALRAWEQRGRIMNRNPDALSVRVRSIRDRLLEASVRAELPVAVLIDVRRFLIDQVTEERVAELEEALERRDLGAVAKMVEG